MTVISKKNQLINEAWKDFSIEVYQSVMDVHAVWDGYVRDRDIFLSERYLRAMEVAPPEGMSFYYTMIRRQDEVCGVVYLQLNHFSAVNSLNYSRNGNGPRNGSLKKVVRDFVAQKIDFYTLTCGNTTITGEHAFLFDNEIGLETRLALVDELMIMVRDHAQRNGYDVQLLFVKDFYDQVFAAPTKCDFRSHYNEFKAQPAMEMSIDPSWQSMQDYLSSLTSKYRVRVRRARKKAGKTRFRPLTLEEVGKHEEELYRLYRKIADKAVFNLFILGNQYFSSLKTHLEDDYQVYGCFEDGKLIAFYSMIANGDVLDAHFLGYEEAVNREHQLYLNMLLNIVECAIERKFGSIFFARTALEIKSSVGAEPHEMYFYLQHSKGFHNKLLPHIYNLLDPKEEWTPRSPFKD